jgi:uncharacterized protein (DUF1778 family)
MSARHHKVSTSFTDDEYEIVKTLAELAGTDLPDFLRAAALSAHGGHVERIHDALARADRAERDLIEIVHTVKRIADGTR